MYQYRGYRLDYTDSAISIRDLKGNFIGYCENDVEAISYIDEYLDHPIESAPIESDDYYIYRVRKCDKNCYDNYQYYDGRIFQYRVTAKKMTKFRAEAIVVRYLRWDDEYNYYIGR